MRVLLSDACVPGPASLRVGDQVGEVGEFGVAERLDHFRHVFATEARVGTAASEIETATAPCQHLGLFMGARTLRTIWPKIARWLNGKPASPRRSSRSAGPDAGAPPG